MTVAGRYSIGTLLKLASSDSTVDRRAACFALGLMGDETHVDYLGPLLSDHDQGVRMVVDDAIKSIWERAIAPGFHVMVQEMHHQFQANRWREGIAIVSELIAIDPRIPDWFCQRGLAKLQLDDFEGACMDCDRALKISKFHYPAWIGLAYGRLEQGQPLVALGHFRRALQVFPDLDYIRQQIHSLERALWELQ